MKKLLTRGINFILNLKGRQNYEIIYPRTTDWVTSSIIIRWGETDREHVMRWYREKYSQAKGIPKRCWLNFVQLNFRGYFVDRALYVDHTCWPGEENKERMKDMELELSNAFPNLAYTKYYNVPIEYNTEVEENVLKRLYFPEYDKLHQTKMLFDPYGMFDQHQGIWAHNEF